MLAWCSFFQFPALNAHVCVNGVRFDVRFALNHFPEKKPTKCREYHNTVDQRCVSFSLEQTGQHRQAECSVGEQKAGAAVGKK